MRTGRLSLKCRGIEPMNCAVGRGDVTAGWSPVRTMNSPPLTARVLPAAAFLPSSVSFAAPDSTKISATPAPVCSTAVASSVASCAVGACNRSDAPVPDFFCANLTHPESTATSASPRPWGSLSNSARVPGPRLRMVPPWNSICACPLASVWSMSPSRTLMPSETAYTVAPRMSAVFPSARVSVPASWAHAKVPVQNNRAAIRKPARTVLQQRNIMVSSRWPFPAGFCVD